MSQTSDLPYREDTNLKTSIFIPHWICHISSLRSGQLLRVSRPVFALYCVTMVVDGACEWLSSNVLFTFFSSS